MTEKRAVSRQADRDTRAPRGAARDDTGAIAWSEIASIPWRIHHAEVDPAALFRDAEAQLVHRRPGGQTWRVFHGGLSYYVKAIGPAFTNRLGTPWKRLRLLRWGIRGLTVRRTFRIHQRMSRRGLACPAVALFAAHGRGFGRWELIVTKTAEGQNFDTALAASDTQQCTRLLEVTARAMMHLHDSGVQHGHLLPGHVMYDHHTDRVTFIDNDENVFQPFSLTWRQRKRNLDPFVYRFLYRDLYRQRVPSKAIRRLLRHYLNRYDPSPPRRRRRMFRILRDARRRHRRRCARRAPNPKSETRPPQ